MCKSKADALKYVRSKLEEYGCCQVPVGHPGYDFLMSVLERHPEYQQKIGSGIKSFEIADNPMSPGKHLSLTRTDGSYDCFSWRSCCGVVKSQYAYACDLFRAAVYDSMYWFRFNKRCEKCSARNDLHTHHDGIQFKTIVADFIKASPGNMPTGYVRTSVTSIDFKPDEQHIKQAFIQYHSSVCSLKILCQKCHKLVHAS